jgi:hypothetical protein
MIEVESVPDARTPEQRAEDDAVRVQAMTEGVELPRDPDTGQVMRKVPFMGRDFRIADEVGLMPLMEFAYHANSGMSTSDMGALAAMYEMLRDCIHEDEWAAFRAHATEKKAGAEQLMETVQAATELLTARPTMPVSGSSSQSPTTRDSLTDSSSGPRAGLVPVSDLGKVVSSA